MNIAMRKLAMLEKSFQEREERLRVEGFTSSPIDSHLRHQVQDLMEKIKVL